jgi:hypothetical protein
MMFQADGTAIFVLGMRELGWVSKADDVLSQLGLSQVQIDTPEAEPVGTSHSNTL